MAHELGSLMLVWLGVSVALAPMLGRMLAHLDKAPGVAPTQSTTRDGFAAPS